MILQREYHTTFRRFGQTTLDAINDPFEAFFFRMPRQHRLDASMLHQLIKTLNRPPTARIETQTRNSHLVTNLDAFFGMLDIVGYFGRIGTEERLMGREADWGDSVAEGLAFESL